MSNARSLSCRKGYRRKVGSLKMGDVFDWQGWLFIVTSDQRHHRELFSVNKYTAEAKFCSESCFGINVVVRYLGQDLVPAIEAMR